MQWFHENSNLVFGVIFVLTVVLKGKFLALIFRIKTISASAFKKKISGEDLTIIDVRSYGEFNNNHISKAICLPLNELTNERLSKMKQTYTNPVYVICASGNRSLWASISMKKAGLNPINVKGGMLFYNRV